MSCVQNENSVVLLLVHVENAEHAGEDGFPGLLRAHPVPDVTQRSAEVGHSRGEASAEELRR